MIATERFAMTKLVITFNRHFFVLALLGCAVGAVLLRLFDQPVVRVVVDVGMATALYIMVVSVIASYFIYDRSDLYKLRDWPSKSFEATPAQAVLVHAGFDPTSGALRSRYPDMKLRVLDFFKPEETTEASIKLAHRLNPPSGPQEHVALALWPVDSASQDAVLALSAAHEIRDDSKRVLFFREAKRVLRPGGRLVVIEQLRDLPNVLCFGFAALHFLSYSTWLRSFRGAGLTIEKEFKISAFMRAFVLRG